MIAGPLSLLTTQDPRSGTATPGKPPSADGASFAGLVADKGDKAAALSTPATKLTLPQEIVDRLAGARPVAEPVQITTTDARSAADALTTADTSAEFASKITALFNGPSAAEDSFIPLAFGNTAQAAAADNAASTTFASRAISAAGATPLTGATRTISGGTISTGNPEAPQTGLADSTLAQAAGKAGAEKTLPPAFTGVTGKAIAADDIPQPILLPPVRTEPSSPRGSRTEAFTAPLASGIAPPKSETAPGLAIGSISAKADAAALTANTTPGTAVPSLLGTVTSETASPLFAEGRGPFVDVSAQALRAATPTQASAVRIDAFQQVANAIRFQSTDQKVMLRLDPPDLGRVGIELSFDNNRLATALLSAENGDTAHLLRRSLDSLQRELNAAGFEGVDIDFADNQTQGEQTDLPAWDDDVLLGAATPPQYAATSAQRMNIITADRIDARF